jgi:hypothetical protein
MSRSAIITSKHHSGSVTGRSSIATSTKDNIMSVSPAVYESLAKSNCLLESGGGSEVKIVRE